MFLNLTIDLFLLLGAGINLLLWYRFSDGKRLSSLFRNLFFVCLIGFVGSMMYRYNGMENHAEWLITGSQVGMLGIVSILISVLSRRKIPLLFSALIVMGSLITGKSWIDRMVINKTDLPEISSDWEFLVKTASGRFPYELDVVKEHNLTIAHAFTEESNEQHELDNYFAINVPAACQPNSRTIKMQLESSHAFEVVEWNEVMRLEPELVDLQRNTPLKTWANDPDIDKQWYFDLLQIDEVHRYLNFTKKKPKKVAQLCILDSGIDAKHPDLSGHYKSVRSVHDRDSNGHGTHCAGIAAAVTNNGRGIASMVPSPSYVQVSSVRVMSPFGIGTQRTIINGILEAVDAGADVISLSLGGVSSDQKQAAYTEAFQYAYDQNVVVVVAAGNSSDEAIRYTPANVPGVICVSAIDQTQQRSIFSNYMNDIEMPLAAPGTEIYSTMPNNKYAAMSGTSMSTPFVSSIAALMKSIDPSLSGPDIFGVLHNTGLETLDDLSTGRIIQPYEAIKMLKSEPIVKTSRKPLPPLVKQRD